jgi:hypothetical protein
MISNNSVRSGQLALSSINVSFLLKAESVLWSVQRSTIDDDFNVNPLFALELLHHRTSSTALEEYLVAWHLLYAFPVLPIISIHRSIHRVVTSIPSSITCVIGLCMLVLM